VSPLCPSLSLIQFARQLPCRKSIGFEQKLADYGLSKEWKLQGISIF
jgi:hypothetical protein